MIMSLDENHNHISNSAYFVQTAFLFLFVGLLHFVVTVNVLKNG